MRTSPSVGYVPYIAEWWQVITEAVRASFVSVLCGLLQCKLLSGRCWLRQCVQAPAWCICLTSPNGGKW